MKNEWEKSVVRRVLQGDHDAFAAVVEHYGAPVYNLMYRMTGNPDEASELAQEAFTRAFEQLRRFDDKRRFFPWLYTVALNVARNHNKRSSGRRAVPLPESLSAPNANNPEGEFQIRLREQNLQTCMNHLEPHEKDAVILRYYQDLQFEEIAAILGISCSAAKMRVYRALKRLKVWLEE